MCKTHNLLNLSLKAYELAGNKVTINSIGDEFLRRGILKDALLAYKKADNHVMIKFFEENFKEQLEKQYRDYL